MSEIKAHLEKDQLGWIIADCFGEKELLSLANQCGILNRRKERAVLKNWFANDLATCFFSETLTERTVSQHLGKKAEEAVKRIQYMSLEEIRTFLNSIEQLLEDGEFGEVLWAMLMDSREAVQKHGYRLLAEHDRLNISTWVEETPAESSSNADSVLLVEFIELPNPSNGSGHLNIQPAPLAEREHHENVVEKLQQTINSLKTQQVALEHENETLNRKIAELEAENKELRTQSRRFQEYETQQSQLEQENRTLRNNLDRFSKQLCEFENFQAEKDKLAVDLKSVEDIAYNTQHALERMRSNFEAQFSYLQRVNEEYKSALIQTRKKVMRAGEPRKVGLNRIMADQPRVGVFVDVQNMFYAAKDRYSRRLDYIKLLDLIVGPRNLIVAYAYVVQIPEINQSGFLSLLEHNGYTIKSKDLRMRGDGSAKGDWDVGIAVDVVGMLDGLDVVILASGDGDFCALADVVKRRGKRIEVVAFEHNTSLDLQRTAHQFHPIGDDMLI